MKTQNYVIYVEKKEPFNVEAKQLFNDIITNLGCDKLHNVRILNKYIVANIDAKTYKRSLNTIFSEPSVDYLYINKFAKKATEIAFGVSFLPGQFDQRADSTEQCLRLINPKSNPIVNCSTIYVLRGELTPTDILKIKKYLINSVDSCEVNINVKSIRHNRTNIKPIETIHGFTKWNNSKLEEWHKFQSLSMTLNDLLLIRDYFISERRNPTITEIKVIDTYWSDHCRHTTFETNLEKITFDDSIYTKPIKQAYLNYLKSRDNLYGKKTKRKISLMDLATISGKELFKKGKLPQLDVSDENNACSINVDVKIANKINKYLLMFKNETHNHPTEIEPYGGAATCLGGAIRDPLSGRTYVYQAMRITGSGNPTTHINKTIPNKLPQKTIAIGAAKGYSSYGNQIGLATGQVNEIYHDGYVAKHMEVGAVIAAAPKDNVIRKTPSNGDVILLLGGRTGKDGIGGATGSSKSHNDKSVHESGAEVQKGNPIIERKIQRLFRNNAVTKLIKKCNDFGAGGVSVAIGELCPGIDIDLDAVPKKYEGLNGTDLALSESQERMAVVVANKDVKTFTSLANKENLEVTQVAKVTNHNRLRMFWKNKKIVDLSRDFLNTNGAIQYANAYVKAPKFIEKTLITDVTKQWEDMLTNLNVCSKNGLLQRFDSTIGCNTVLLPLGGKNQLTPSEGCAALIPSFNKIPSTTASLMTYGFDPNISDWSCFHMAYYAVVESITKIVAMGGEWRKIYLSFQEYFEKLQKKDESWGKPLASLLGAYTIQQALNIASIGGKDSMSGSFLDMHVPPTLISVAVTTQEANKVISPEFKEIDSSIVLVSPKVLADKTLYLSSLTKNFDAVTKGIHNKSIVSAYSLKSFGVAEGISKMAIGNDIGVTLVSLSPRELFEANYGSLIIEIPKGISINKVLKGANYKLIGKTIHEAVIECVGANINIPINKIKTLLQLTLKDVYVKSTKENKQQVSLPHVISRTRTYSKKIVKTPLVVIPVFPGTNCEYDSQYAFERAGAKVQQVLIKNLTPNDLLHSIDELVKAIKQANILMLPGGFSAGDEPDGSAKFIVNIFNNEKVKQATEELIHKRDGLIIGICNGFQALIKLGLLPYGHIGEQTKDSPTLTFNKIHHHMSSIVRTKLISNKSPWLKGINVGDIRLVPISHGEGQFVASQKQINELSKNGQIAFQYVDQNGQASMSMPDNPNGSAYAIEGIISADGRVLGKMGHSERIGKDLYKNVIGLYDQKIFESGVKYFTHKK